MKEGAQQSGDSHIRRYNLLAWLRMLRIVRRTEHAAIHELRTQLGDTEISYAQFDVIAQLGSAEGITQSQLAQRLLVTQGNITQLLDKMEVRGWVRRCREGRTNVLHLTDAGRELYQRAVPQHEDWQAARLDGLTPEEQAQLLRLLAKLDRAQRGKQ